MVMAQSLGDSYLIDKYLKMQIIMQVNLVDRLEMSFSYVKGYACICKRSDLVIIFEKGNSAQRFIKTTNYE